MLQLLIIFLGVEMSDSLRTRLVFAAFMSILMSFIMSAWVTWLNLGFGPAYLPNWLKAFLAAWPAAFSIVVIFGPTVQRISQKALRYLPKG